MSDEIKQEIKQRIEAAREYQDQISKHEAVFEYGRDWQDTLDELNFLRRETMVSLAWYVMRHEKEIIGDVELDPDYIPF